MILGAVAAMTQKNFKRLLAYSSIGHIGYALAGVATGADAGSGPGNSDNLVAVVINNVFSHKGHYKLLAVSLYNNNIGAEACGQDP